MVDSNHVKQRLSACLESEIRRFVVKDKSAYVEVQAISGREIESISKQFDIPAIDIGISPYKSDSVIVYFEVPVDNRLLATIPITHFCCEVCDKHVTDEKYKATEQVARTEDCLYCETCWKDRTTDEPLIRMYNPNETIDDIPREINVWTMDVKSDMHLV